MKFFGLFRRAVKKEKNMTLFSEEHLANLKDRLKFIVYTENYLKAGARHAAYPDSTRRELSQKLVTYMQSKHDEKTSLEAEIVALEDYLS